MNAFAQRVEEPDRNYQYLLVAAEPYETFSFWDPDAKEYWIQIMFMTEREERYNAAPGLGPRS
ncbi:unnamed protein product [Clonostachys rosea f. rosea IK726]|nr:unnamed protein product [Clonostachys rosea f. rosea IK726]